MAIAAMMVLPSCKKAEVLKAPVVEEAPAAPAVEEEIAEEVEDFVEEALDAEEEAAAE